MEKIKFKTEKTWTVGNQEWSDIIIQGDKKHFTFDEGLEIDKQLTDDWRVPTREDFINLDIALGGTGQNGQNNQTLVQKYIDEWGGAYGGYVYLGKLRGQGTHADYWSQTENNADSGYNMYLYSNGYIYPQGNNLNEIGFALRCIRQIK